MSINTLYKKYLSYAIKLAITLAIFFFIFKNISLANYQHVLGLISLKEISGIFLLLILQILFLSSRWFLLARAEGSQLSFPISVFGILMSFFFSQGLPASIGGDAFRIWWHQREGISISSAVKIIFFDRIYGMLSLLMLCVVSLSLLTLHFGHTLETKMLLILVIAMGLTLGSLLLPFTTGLSQRIESLSLHCPIQLKNILQWLVKTRITLRQQPIHLTLKLLSMGMIVHGLTIFQIYLIGTTFLPEKMTFAICMAAVPPALLISYMPFSIAGWGIREASMVVALGLFAIPAEIAVLISIVIGMIIFGISLLGGVLWLFGGFRASYLSNPNENSLMNRG